MNYKFITTVFIAGCIALQASEIIVTNPNDRLPGMPAEGPGLCLRDAVEQAAPGDVIRVDIDKNLFGGIPSSSSYIKSTISIYNPMTIIGDGSLLYTNAADTWSVFDIQTHDTSETVNLSNFVLTGGAARALKVTSGACDMDSCRVKNTASGGGLSVFPGALLDMANCTVDSNSGADGGGIYSGGTLYLTNCTVDSNNGNSGGGGIRISDGSYAKITNSTMSHNIGGSGGGIVIGIYGATCVINACTIAYNNTQYNAGGIFGYATPGSSPGKLYLYNSIIAGNYAPVLARSNIWITDTTGQALQDHWNNAVGPSTNYTASFTDWTTTASSASGIFSSAANSSDTGLLYLDTALSSNGGATQTLAIKNSSSIAKNIDYYYQAMSQITAPDSADSDNFGNSVAISTDGDTICVGAETHNKAYTATYSNNNLWGNLVKYAMSFSLNDHFGHSVAISYDKNTIEWGWPVVGIPYYNKGEVLMFYATSSGYNLLPSGSNGNFGDSFGNSVSCGTNITVIGSPGYNTGRGKVYIYNNASPLTSIAALDSAVNDNFGSSVAVSGDGSVAVIGAYNKNMGAGAAYIFKKVSSNWTQRAEMTLSDGQLLDNFGSSVAISSDSSTIAVGAPNRGNFHQGAVYVYNNSGTLLGQLTASDSDTCDYFGSSVAISSNGDTIVVGAPENNPTTGQGAGKVYIFSYSGSNWSQLDSIVAPDGSVGDWFGTSVDVSGDGTTVVVGASHNSVGTHTNNGAAYVYFSPDDSARLPDTDQRGYSRTAPRNCIGAFEYGASL